MEEGSGRGLILGPILALPEVEESHGRPPTRISKVLAKIQTFTTRIEVRTVMTQANLPHNSRNKWS
jgi:hypothetical protein